MDLWRTMSPPAQKVRHGVVAPLEVREKRGKSLSPPSLELRDKRDKRDKRGKSSLALTFPRLSRFSRSIAGGKPAFVRSPTLYAEQIEWVSVGLRALRAADRAGTVRHRTSVLDRFPDPLRDHRRVVGDVQCHSAVEPLRSGEEHSHAAPKWIRGNPGFKRPGQMTASGFDGRLDPLPLGHWNSFAVEHCEWHLRSVLRLGRSHCIGPPNPSRPSAGAPGPLLRDGVPWTSLDFHATPLSG